MGIMTFSLLKAAGIRVAMANDTPTSTDKYKSERYTGIPQIPADVGFHRIDTEGKEKKRKSKFMSVMERNPLVLIGCGLTTAALIGMFYKSLIGDKIGTQKYMQYRVTAQFFTITALVAGVTIFASYKPTQVSNEGS